MNYSFGILRRAACAIRAHGSASLAAVGFLLWPVLSAKGQDPQQERQRELERLIELEEQVFQPQEDTEFEFDYGGWLRPNWFSFRDGGGQDRSQMELDLRLWTNLRYGAFQLYLRGMTEYWTWASGDGPERDEHEYVWPRLEVGLIQTRLGVLLDDYDRIWDADLRLGRQYLKVGTGLVLNDIHEGATATFRLGPASLQPFAVRGLVHKDDLDASRPRADDTRRNFLGGVLRTSFAFGKRVSHPPRESVLG